MITGRCCVQARCKVNHPAKQPARPVGLFKLGPFCRLPAARHTAQGNPTPTTHPPTLHRCRSGGEVPGQVPGPRAAGGGRGGRLGARALHLGAAGAGAPAGRGWPPAGQLHCGRCGEGRGVVLSKGHDERWAGCGRLLVARLPGVATACDDPSRLCLPPPTLLRPALPTCRRCVQTLCCSGPLRFRWSQSPSLTSVV